MFPQVQQSLCHAMDSANELAAFKAHAADLDKEVARLRAAETEARAAAATGIEQRRRGTQVPIYIYIYIYIRGGHVNVKVHI